ncbi:hypothetical protein RvY_10540 [Ramazzottius varieornatus]|uniref:Uncharacterized protein n=1 Tax=Ramazzottius varieornatus TaxID=947166 RepID=A0A1D1VD30_RAMVA|nr:hypothetical protein RvY_10540 [Ramazzottius varieornatus]
MAEQPFPESSRNEPSVREAGSDSYASRVTSKIVFPEDFELVKNPYASPMDEDGDPFDDFLSSSGDHGYPQAMELQSMGPQAKTTDGLSETDNPSSSEVLSHSEKILARVRTMYEQGILGKCNRKSSSTPSRPNTGRSAR